MSTRHRGALAVLLTAVVLALSGCSTPPDDLNNKAMEAKQQIEDARQANVKAAKEEFPKLRKQPKFAFTKGYTIQQLHVDRFDLANAKIEEAQKLADEGISPHQDNYEAKNRDLLEGNIATVNRLVSEARTLSADPKQWLETLAATKADPQGTLRTAAGQIDAIRAEYAPLAKNVDKAKATYASNAKAIDAKFMVIKRPHDDALQAHRLLQAEATKPAPHYAVMAEQATTVKNSLGAIRNVRGPFIKRLAQLDENETRTLIDIRVDSEVIIYRSSWDDSSESPDVHNYQYRGVLVDAAAADHFVGFKPDKKVAVDGAGGFKIEKPVNADHWAKLNIKAREKWTKGDSNSEFYLELREHYCHRIFVLKNGAPNTARRPKPADNRCSAYDTPADLTAGTYWIQSDKLTPNAIGMDIYSKSVGEFDSQANKVATPPGMVYVGDADTGQWQTDSVDGSFWDFNQEYQRFAELIGGPYPGHYRHEYEDWAKNYRSGKKPYYGNLNGGPRFGLKSPQVASRFSGSTFVKSGLYTAAVRGTGAAARAGS